MRLIIEVRSHVLVDVPDTDAADDVGCDLCIEVETAIHDAPEESGARHAHIDTHYTVWDESDCEWLDGDECKRANDRLENKWRKPKRK